MNRWGIVLLFALIGLTANHAWAQSSGGNIDQAREYFERGIQLVEQGRWEDALVSFERSLAIHPTATASYNRALCLGLAGRLVQSMRAFEAYLQRYGDSITPQRREEVRTEMRNLRGRMGRIDVRVQGAQGASITLDGEEVGTSPLSRPLEVDPGRHQITVRSEEISPVSRWVNVGAGDEVSVVIALERGAVQQPDQPPDEGDPPPVTPPVGPGPQVVPAEPTDSGRGLRIGAYASTGVAVATLGVALALFLWNNSQYDTWTTEDAALRSAYGTTETETHDPDSLAGRLSTNNNLVSTIETVDVLSWVFLGIGSAAAAAAVVLYVLGFRSNENVQVGFAPQRGGGLFCAGWTF